MSVEESRLQFIMNRDGFEASVEFTKRGMSTYRKAVLHTKGLVHKREFIDRYLDFKRYYILHKV